MKILRKALFVAIGVAISGVSLADVTIGVTVSATGPAAALGGPEKNLIALLPATLGGEKVQYIVLDDATDPSAASRNAQKLVSESKVDAIIGSSTVPTAVAASRFAAEGKTPIIVLSPIRPVAEVAPWVFITPQSVSLVASVVVRNMVASGVKTLGFIGYSDPYGEDWWNNLSKAAEGAGIKIVASERFNRTDTSVTGQAVKILAANPDAVFIGASGTPSALPQTTLADRGYKGKFYQSHGSTSKEYVKVAGKAAEGTILPAAPMLVAEQLPDSNPSKKPGLDFVKLYEGAHGTGNRSVFAALAYDAYLLLSRAVPEASKKAKPGTPEFRLALRDALENIRELPAAYGVFNMSPTNHNGLDDRAVVMIRVENGDWKLVK